MIIQISSDDYEDVSIRVGRIEAIADAICHLDENSELSSAGGLLKHTLCGLAHTIVSEAMLVKESLQRAETAESGDKAS